MIADSSDITILLCRLGWPSKSILVLGELSLVCLLTEPSESKVVDNLEAIPFTFLTKLSLTITMSDHKVSYRSFLIDH